MSKWIICHSDDYLMHHGVKGQKWGVRRTPEQLGYKVGKDYIKISAADQNAKGGVSHVSSKKKVSPKAAKMYVYDQTNARDKEVYEGAYSKYLTMSSRQNKVFSNKYKLKDDIYAATTDAQKKEFDKLYESDKDVKRVTDLVQTYLESAKWYENPTVKEALGKKIDDPQYRKFMAFNSDAAWGAKRPEISVAVNKYMDHMKDLGFNALIDSNNVNIYNGASMPLIMMNGKEQLKRTGATKIPMSVINANIEAIRSRQNGHIALSEEDFGAVKFVDIDNYLMHHGVKGQKWGVRRTPEQLGHTKAQKALAGKGPVTLPKGTRFYRATTSNESDEKYDMLYVDTNKREANRYLAVVGLDRLASKNRLNQQVYESKDEIKIPSVAEQGKIERALLDDPDIKACVVKSLARKGMNPDAAYERLDKPSLAKAIMQTAVLTPVAVAGAMLGMTFTAGNLAVQPLNDYRKKKAMRDSILRVSMGDHDVEMMRHKIIAEFNKRGFTAIRDTNDKFNGVKSNYSVILLNRNQISMTNNTPVTRDSFIDSQIHWTSADTSPRTRGINRLTEEQKRTVFGRQWDVRTAMYDQVNKK